MWVTINWDDIKSDAPSKYKFEGHAFKEVNIKGVKPVCKNCGHMALNNSFSKWYTDKGCNAHLHPQYQNQRRKAGEGSLLK